MKSFSELSYRMQVKILRNLAVKGLGLFPFKDQNVKLKFINHGENTTFKVTDAKHGQYLMRICRNDYHTDLAIKEELKWLNKLSQNSNFQIPIPVVSIKNNFIERVCTEQIPEGRNVCIFKWTDGKFIRKSFKDNQFIELGRFIAQLHNASQKHLVKYRRYWTSDGLLGTKPKFGSVDNLENISSQQQHLISSGRKFVYKRLKKYENKFPKRLGLIHADLHFGNLIFNNKGIAAIDFDDCGFGFLIYDLAIPIISMSFNKHITKVQQMHFRSKLLEGYSQLREFDKHDQIILDDLIMARHLVMLGWLNSRSDNPKLKLYLKKSVPQVVKKIKQYFNKIV